MMRKKEIYQSFLFYLFFARYQQIFNNLQENVLPADQSLDELNDSNSLLSQAINSAVKDLEHAVDADWFFQSEPGPPNSADGTTGLPTSGSGPSTSSGNYRATASGQQQQQAPNAFQVRSLNKILFLYFD